MDMPNVAETPEVLSLGQGGDDWFAEQWRESGYEPGIYNPLERINRAALGATVVAELLAADWRLSERAADSGEQYVPLSPRYIDGLHVTLRLVLDGLVQDLEDMRERNRNRNSV